MIYFLIANVLHSSSRDANKRYSEISGLLEGVHNELNEAKADKSENARSQQKAELTKNLQNLYPGVYGRLVDLCEPVHKRYSMIYAWQKLVLYTSLLCLNSQLHKFQDQK